MVKDFMGNTYTTVSEMCSKYGVKKETYIQRISEGKTQQEALTMVAKASKRNTNYENMADRMMEIRLSLNENGEKKGPDDLCMTQKQFALYLSKITGYGTDEKNALTLMMVSCVENARRAYDIEVYISLARELNISLDYIFGRTDDETPYKPANGFKTYYERIKDITDEGTLETLELKKRSTEARLVIADKLKVPLDYLCGLTDETKIKK